MRLDPKRTLDELIASLAPDAQTRERTLSNRIYRELSSAVAGAQEFSAVAKLYQLDRDGGFDVIVLDTPPSRNALDFLDAPGRLARFFDGRALRAASSRRGASRRGSRAAPAHRSSRCSSGCSAATCCARSAPSSPRSASMVDGLGARAAAVEALLRDPGTRYVLVASPRREAVDEAIAFEAELVRAGVKVASARRQPRPRGAGGARAGRARAAARASGSPGWSPTASRRQAAMAAADAASLERLRRRSGVEPVVVPELGSEVYDIEGLRTVALALGERAVAAQRDLALGRAVVLAASRRDPRAAGPGAVARGGPGPRRPARPRAARARASRRARRAPGADGRRRGRAGARADAPRSRRRAPPRPRRPPPPRRRDCSSEIACATRSVSAPRSGSVAQSAAMRPARRPLRGPSGSSSARSASRWSERPVSGSSRSQPISKRASAHAGGPSTGRRRETRLTNERSSSSCAAGDQRAAVAAAAAGDRQGPPRGALAADPRERRERHPRRVQPQRRLQVAQLAERLLERAGARARDDRHDGRGDAAIAPQGVGRQHLEVLERHQQHALRDLDRLGLAADPSQQRGEGELAALGCRQQVELAVGGLEALGSELEVRGARRRGGGRSSAARPARWSRRRGAPARRSRGTRRGRRARPSATSASAALPSRDQPFPVALDEVPGARLPAVEAAVACARRPPRRPRRGSRRRRRPSRRASRRPRTAKACSDAWSLEVCMSRDSSARPRILPAQPAVAATRRARRRAARPGCARSPRRASGGRSRACSR